MRFREGLLYACKHRQADGVITNPFHLYCRLSDLCASSFEDKKKVELFYAIDKRLCIFETLLKTDKNGEEELFNSYLVVSDLLSEGSFRKLIECAVWAINPSSTMPTQMEARAQVSPSPKPCCKRKHTPKHTPQNTPQNMPQNTLPTNIQPVQVQSAPVSVQMQTRTPLKTGFSLGVGDEETLFITGGVILILASLLVGLFGLLVGVFKWDIPWMAWQIIIGIVGGGWLFLGLSLLIYLLEDSATCDYYVAGVICLAAVAVLNFILQICLGINYKGLFTCLSVWVMIGGVVLAIICFDDVEDEWGWGFVGVTVAELLLMIVGLIWL